MFQLCTTQNDIQHLQLHFDNTQFLSLQFAHQIAEAPSAHAGSLPSTGARAKDPKDAELEAQLARLMKE